MARRVALALLLAAGLSAAVGMLLPGRVEVVRTAHLPAPPRAVHAALATLPEGPSWCAWRPALRGGLVVTASRPGGGLWLDVAGRGRRRAALLLEAEGEGTRLTWHDVLHVSGGPWARYAALGRERRVGAELEASLDGLAAHLAASPPRAPRVVVVLADDLGWELLRRAPTPNLDAMAAAGTTFSNLWVNPKCGPTRASLLTGRFHFRIGGGEIARVHRNRSMSLEELTLPEVLGPERCAAFGKWHLSNDPAHPNLSGFGHFAGSLGNLNGASYFEWPKVVDGVESTCTTYATTEVTNDALASDADFQLVAYHAAHTPFHDPPPELAPTAPRGQGDDERLLATVEALDTEVGRLLAAHPDDWVIFLSDNGTTELVDEGGKGTVEEAGINVPLIVRGPGVREGVVADDLVNVVDLFATVAELLGVEAGTEDSISFAPVLHGQPGRRRWNYSCLFWEATPNRRIHAVRDAQYKLVVNYDKSFELYRMPGEVPVDLEASPPEVRARYEALDELRRGLR